MQQGLIDAKVLEYQLAFLVKCSNHLLSFGMPSVNSKLKTEYYTSNYNPYVTNNNYEMEDSSNKSNENNN